MPCNIVLCVHKFNFPKASANWAPNNLILMHYIDTLKQKSLNLRPIICPLADFTRLTVSARDRSQ